MGRPARADFPASPTLGAVALCAACRHACKTPSTGQQPRCARSAPHAHGPQGGGNINDVQAKTFARIQLSKANEYFPGTTERTLLVTGRLKQVGRQGQELGRVLQLQLLEPESTHLASWQGPSRGGSSSWLTRSQLPALQVVAALGLLFAKLLREGVAPLRCAGRSHASLRSASAVACGEPARGASWPVSRLLTTS